MWQVEFTSDAFLPFLPEECQGNPGVYGYELAGWLSQALARQGVVTSYPIGEDWGWLLERVAGDTELMIGCASQSDEGEGYTGAPLAWSVFVQPHRSLRRRPKAEVARAAVDELARAIRVALEAEGIEVRVVQG